MESQEPEVRERRTDKPGRSRIVAVHIVHETFDFAIQQLRIRRDKMDTLHHPVARHNAHRPFAIVPEASNRYLG